MSLQGLKETELPRMEASVSLSKRECESKSLCLLLALCSWTKCTASLGPNFRVCLMREMVVFSPAVTLMVKASEGPGTALPDTWHLASHQ